MAEEKEEVAVAEEEVAAPKGGSIKSLVADIDRMLEGAGVPAGEEAPAEAGAEEAPVEEAVVEEAVVEEAAGTDVSALVEALEIDEAKAAALYQAAQEMERTRGVTPEELAAMLAEDFNLRMQLERVAGIAEEGAEAEAGMEALEAPAPEVVAEEAEVV